MMENLRIVVVGGSAAGPKAAAKARRMDQHAEISIVQQGADLSMASCGYPYYVGGVFDDRNQLLCTPTGVVRDSKYYVNAKGIRALTLTEAVAIDREGHRVLCRHVQTGQSTTLEYDRLVLATGTEPVMPNVPGTNLDGITTLQSLGDADYLRQIRDEGRIKKAVVVGGGLIGMETCEALHLAGIQITVVEALPQILCFLDWDLAKLLEKHVTSKGAMVITGNPVAEFLGQAGKLTGVKLRNGTELSCELAVVAVGVRPKTALAKAAGIHLGPRGGIKVNEFMQTSDPDIFACGDCCEITHRITGESMPAYYGDLANLEGRVVGQNVVLGPSVRFPGTIHTAICRVFDWTAGTTGLSEEFARQAGFDVESVIVTALDRPGFMQAKPLIMKMVADRQTQRVLGVQCVGPGEVSKRIAVAATAIMGSLAVDDFCNLDLPYAPPFSQAVDAIIVLAHAMENKLTGRMQTVSARELKRKLDTDHRLFLLDTRGPDEFEEMRLGHGETLVPIGALRTRLGELPEDKSAEIVCFCKISLRGYEAASLLSAHGYTNVKVLEGGLLAWPFPREK
jgi:NADPH-dependent 2,4-dienoyl-CoA reductase/sulfur reductase-like enzyme/rhodanese-related sulfurtransferase